MANARYWNAVLYPENMIDDWQITIGDILGVSYCYCIHDKDMLADYKPKKDKGEDYQRKTHIHLILAFNNTTTYKNALATVNKLSKENCQCCNKVETTSSIRNSYDYLIHNTETSKKQGKYQYDVSERVCGNNFDIGSFEQVSKADKIDMVKELANLIYSSNYTNFADFTFDVMTNYDNVYVELLVTYSGFLERIIKGQYHKAEMNKTHISEACRPTEINKE